MDGPSGGPELPERLRNKEWSDIENGNLVEPRSECLPQRGTFSGRACDAPVNESWTTIQIDFSLQSESLPEVSASRASPMPFSRILCGQWVRSAERMKRTILSLLAAAPIVFAQAQTYT